MIIYNINLSDFYRCFYTIRSPDVDNNRGSLYNDCLFNYDNYINYQK